jgi:hypothetical protein
LNARYFLLYALKKQIGLAARRVLIDRFLAIAREETELALRFPWL